MEKVINFYKKCGQTPLDCVKEIKKNNPKLTNLSMTYAGRLDPLAEGVLLILVGKECLKKDEYLKLEKEYELTILFGFETDTYDLLGKVKDQKNNFIYKKEEIKKILLSFFGKIKQVYPPFSSKPIKGKPLFVWARENKLDKIKIPSHDVYIKKIELIKESEIKGEELIKKIKKDIYSVKGDFRQEEINSLWQKILSNKQDKIYKTITLKISCGSGVYVRVLAHEIGQALDVSSLALKIVRTKVGKYTIQK